MTTYKLVTIDQRFTAETIARTGSEQLLEKAMRSFVGLYNEEESWYIPLRANLGKKKKDTAIFKTPFPTTNPHFKNPGLDFEKAVYVPNHYVMEIQNTLPEEQSKLIFENQEVIRNKFEDYVLSVDSMEKDNNNYLFSTVPLFPEGIEKIKQIQQRREEVKKYIETKEYHKIWKNLILISCWGDMNSTEYLKKIQEIFPNTVIQEKGLLATEGFISFPDAEKNLSKLSFYSHFFEFLSLDDNKIYNISEIEANKKYELILTTSGGLYRYCIGDIIEVISIENNVPYIKFVGRKGAVSDLFGEKLEESFLKNIMETYKQKIDFYMFAPNRNHYILFIKTDKKINVQDLENKLRENFHYDYCRKLGQLKAIKVFTLTGQPEKEYIQACQNKNQKLGNIKMTALSKESGWENIFSGYFQESEDK